MEKQYKLEIITPQEVVFSGDVVSAVAPGELGYLGILANHAPLVTTLLVGKFTLRKPDEKTVSYKTQAGFLEVLENRAVALVDGAELIG